MQGSHPHLLILVSSSPKPIIHCLPKVTTTGLTIILVYVDDLVLTCTDLLEIQLIKALLDEKFSIKDLKILKYFLGFEVARFSAGIALYQRKYCLDLLQDIGLIGSKPCSTPMDPNQQLHKSSGDTLPDPTAYRRLVGHLLYLTHTHPDICYAVGRLSQYLESPTTLHMQAAMHIIKFLKGNLGKGLFFSSTWEGCN